MNPALDLQNVTVALGRPPTVILDDVSLRVEQCSIHALIGESGSGKSTLAKAAAGLVRTVGGTVQLSGTQVEGHPMRSAQAVQMVFQDPISSLDPRFTAEACILEAVRRDRSVDESSRAGRVRELCDMVAYPSQLLDRLPSQLSGGQCQRVAIARAIAPRPSLLIADEITSSLDVTVQAQIVDLIEHLASQLNLSVLFITHDLAIADRLADDLTVLKSGRVVERGVSALDDPKQPYTRTLIDSLLHIDTSQR